MKEVKFRPNIGMHDLQTKLKQIERFLFKEKTNVKVTIFYKGRENAHKDLGVALLSQITDSFGKRIGLGTPSIRDRQISVVLFPKPQGSAGVLAKVS